MRSVLFITFLALTFLIFGQDPIYDICPIKNSEEDTGFNLFDKEGKEINLKNILLKTPQCLFSKELGGVHTAQEISQHCKKSKKTLKI